MKTSDKIIAFFKECGFKYYAPMSGCCEYHKELDEKRGVQINGEGISAIETLDEVICVGIYENDKAEGPWDYAVEYPNFKTMIENEKNVDFSKGLKKYKLIK